MLIPATKEYNDYIGKHTDLLDGLSYQQAKFIEQYLNDDIMARLKQLDALKDKNVEFKGIIGGCRNGISSVVFKTSVVDIKYQDLDRFFPSKSQIIKQVFASAFSELEYVGYLVREGHKEEWEANYTPEKEAVYSSGYTSPEFEICRKFYVLGLPLTQSLSAVYMKAYNFVHKDLKLKAFYEQTGLQIDYKQFINQGVKLFDTINEQVLKGEIPVTGTKELADLAVSFNSARCRVSALGFTEKQLADVPFMTVYKTTTPNGVRTSTLNETLSLPECVSLIEELTIPKERAEMILTYCWFCTGDDKYLEKLSRFNSETLNSVKSNLTLQILKVILMYFLGPEFVGDVKQAQEMKMRQVYPESAIDEVVDIPFSQKCQTVLDSQLTYFREMELTLTQAKKKKNKYSYQLMLIDLANQFINGKGLSEKQRAVISKAYNSMSKQNNTPNFYNDSVERKIRECKAWFQYSSKDFEAQVFTSIQTRKRCSEKQLNILNEAYERMVEAKRNLEETERGRQALLNRHSLSEDSTAPWDDNSQQEQQTQQTQVPSAPEFGNRPFSFSNYDWVEES